MLQQVVEHFLWDHITAQFDDDAHPITVREVIECRYAVDFLLFDQFRDIFDKLLLDHLVRKFGNDDRVLAAVHRFYAGLRLHGNATAPGLVGGAYSLAAQNESGGREIWAGQELHQLFHGRFRVIQQVIRSITDFRQIMRWQVGRHADGDTGTAVTDQVRKFSGEDTGLRSFVIEGRLEINRILFDIFQHLDGERRHTRFRIAVGGGWVIVDTAEVSLTIHQRIAEGEGLCHTHHGQVDRLISVRVIVTNSLPDDLRRLEVPVRRRQIEISHRIENATLNRLEAISHVRQSAGDNSRHRIAQIRVPHFLGNLDFGTIVIIAGSTSATANAIYRWNRRFQSVITGRYFCIAGRYFRFGEGGVVNHSKLLHYRRMEVAYGL